MEKFPDVNRIASVFTNKTRAGIVDVLMDGRAHTLLEITANVHVTPQTVTHHLQSLMSQDLVSMEKSGRFHYFAIKNGEVATTFELLSGIAPAKQTASFTDSTKFKEIDYCRTCYDHIAGFIGVTLTHRFIELGYLTDMDSSLQPTVSGRSFFEKTFATDFTDLSMKKRKFTTSCLDWSERKHHLGGALGNQILHFLTTNDYIAPGSTTRSLVLTPAGKDFFSKHLNLFF